MGAAATAKGDTSGRRVSYCTGSSGFWPPGNCMSRALSITDVAALPLLGGTETILRTFVNASCKVVADLIEESQGQIT